MTPKLSSLAAYLEARASRSLGPVTTIFAAGVLVALLALAFKTGREAQANAQREEAIAVEQENRAFCTGLGVSPETDAYRRCESGLTAIRQRLEQRLAAEATGIL